jgi:hypothetical protein
MDFLGYLVLGLLISLWIHEIKDKRELARRQAAFEKWKQ